MRVSVQVHVKERERETEREGDRELIYSRGEKNHRSKEMSEWRRRLTEKPKKPALKKQPQHKRGKKSCSVVKDHQPNRRS